MSTVFFFGNGVSEGDSRRRDLLGGKGAGLAEMTSLGLPVPPGFTISTEECVRYLSTGAFEARLSDAIALALSKVENSTGMKFGEAESPLLLSVRSGARASMPGMMDTILNLGLNDETVEGLAKKTRNARFAYDAFRRFIAMFGDVALEVKKEHFSSALDTMRLKAAARKGVDVSRFNGEELKRAVPDSELNEEELRTLVATFKDIILRETKKPFPSDPTAQLRAAIEAVFRSWNTPRAIVYRKMHSIPESWGTAVNVQAMVFGNLGATSATGVAFTRDPSTGEKRLYGEWLPDAQGEDVVAGIRTPNPLSGGPTSLEVAMPAAHKELSEIAVRLEKHFRDVQDLEFTVQEGRLFMLQCRSGKRTAKAAVRTAVEMHKEGLLTKKEAVLRVDPASLDQLLHPRLDPKAEKRLLAQGLAASPGAAHGRIVFSADEAERLGGQGQPVILVRTETSPEDIHGMKAARGILTARGGMTSHAAVVARGMGKPCIAGTSHISVNYAAQEMTVSVEDETRRATKTVTLKAGDFITIDGSLGTVYEGVVPTIPASLSDEFGELMAWADESRTMKVRANADTPLDAKTARAFGAEGIGLCRTEHMFFDDSRIALVREMILADTEEDRRRPLEKLLPVQREDFVGIFREMDGCPVTIRLLDPPLHEFLPTVPAQIEELAKTMGVTARKLEQRTKDLHEFNPMLGHRGCRLGVTHPEIYSMQIRAILEAAIIAKKSGTSVLPEIMIPLAMTREELERMRELVEAVVADLKKDGHEIVPFLFGTMIELPRACVVADELAKTAEFFSFGTNDLTQSTMGLSRDDAGRFLPVYTERGILKHDPFVSLDVEGVGPLVRMAVERGKTTRPALKIGVCGEHGGDPASIHFFQSVGLNYVSCSPFRVVVARLAAAQAAAKLEASAVESKGKGATGNVP